LAASSLAPLRGFGFLRPKAPVADSPKRSGGCSSLSMPHSSFSSPFRVLHSLGYVLHSACHQASLQLRRSFQPPSTRHVDLRLPAAPPKRCCLLSQTIRVSHPLRAFFPASVKVLFQTGNTLGLLHLSPFLSACKPCESHSKRLGCLTPRGLAERRCSSHLAFALSTFSKSL
jgi:hypothetical protein